MTKRRKRKKHGIKLNINIKNPKVIIAAAAAVVLIIVIALLIRHAVSDKNSDSEAIVSAETGTVRHLSFPQLSLEPAEGRLSVSEFSQILDMLYFEDYVLVDVYDLTVSSADGSISLNDEVKLPEGKKPLIISQRDVSYPFWNVGNGYAEKLIINAEGSIKCTYTDASGELREGDYDLIPILESYIASHPDFSYNGARGIIGVTGYAGVLGYRTSDYLASTDTNPYGLAYDTASEQASAAEVIKELKRLGWHFASNGFNIVSYGSEPSIMEGDVDMWDAEVKNVVGETDLLIYPMQTDVGSWAPYSDSNEKYVYLKDHGFKYFFINETETPWFIQCTGTYMRQAIYEINTYEQFEQALAAA